MEAEDSAEHVRAVFVDVGVGGYRIDEGHKGRVETTEGCEARDIEGEENELEQFGGKFGECTETWWRCEHNMTAVI